MQICVLLQYRLLKEALEQAQDGMQINKEKDGGISEAAGRGEIPGAGTESAEKMP